MVFSVPDVSDERPKLLVSIHDVSPLTHDNVRLAVELVHAAGIPTSALTILVIPFHEQRVSLADDAPLCEFLGELAAAGATLVPHGYSHRMVGSPRAPWQWFTARVFARDQGELAVCDEAEAARRLDAADEIFSRVNLPLTGFVPPAWLLSRPAAAAVARRKFAFIEGFGGIRIEGRKRPLARRLIGWGSLSWFDALVTAAYAWLVARRRPADTRVAIHPPDLRHARTRRSLERTLRRLVDRLEPVSYSAYLAGLDGGG